jgi:hypothetical protein
MPPNDSKGSPPSSRLPSQRSEISENQSLKKMSLVLSWYLQEMEPRCPKQQEFEEGFYIMTTVNINITESCQTKFLISYIFSDFPIVHEETTSQKL